jgi:1-acyl-sn-glycerol-3-phosphate acyltransferase
MTASFIVLLVRLLCGGYPRWQDCAPDPRPRLYFANHSSNLDAVVLWAALPPALRALTRPVAANDYWTRSALRRHLATEVFHAILIERRKVTAHNNPIETILGELKEGMSLIIFPEGGRFLNPEPAPFKAGVYHLAKKRPDLELVPVLIDNLNRVLPKGEVLPVPLLCSVTFGAPIQLDAGEPKPDFLVRARQAVCDLRKQ